MWSCPDEVVHSNLPHFNIFLTALDDIVIVLEH